LIRCVGRTRHYDGVITTYTDLETMPNAQERGYAFEHYVADLLRRDHFAVVNRPGAANRRQVDLFATRGSDHYLLEVKWHKGKVGTPEIDELLRRLERGVPNIVGVLVSANGFSRPAIERVEQDATRPIVLVTGDELAQVERTGMLHRLLISKHEQLIVHRRASIAEGPLVSAGAEGSASTSVGSYAFVGSDGQRLSTLELDGGFGPVAFCLDLPALDWSDGRGVGVEVALAGSNLAGLREVFARLRERGWVTTAGTWRIHQQGATWNGFGLDALLAALDDPEPRYADRVMHHSETVTYIDTAGGGLYTLTAVVGRTRVDRVSMMTLSFRLPGIPLDPGPLQTLVRSLSVDAEPYFRSLGEPVASRVRLPPELRSRKLHAEALIVGNPAMAVSGGDGESADEWVLGVVVENPFRGSITGLRDVFSDQSGPLAELGRDNQFLVCTLGSWHYLSERREYVIDFVETAQVGDRLLTRVHLDWFDEALADRRRVRPRMSDWLGERIDSALIAATARLHHRFGERGMRVVRVDDPPR
jgi:hypothetical protein